MDLLVDVGDKQEAITELSFKIKGKKIIGLTQALENELDLFFFFPATVWSCGSCHIPFDKTETHACSEEGDLYSSDTVNRAWSTQHLVLGATPSPPSPRPPIPPKLLLDDTWAPPKRPFIGCLLGSRLEVARRPSSLSQPPWPHFCLSPYIYKMGVPGY